MASHRAANEAAADTVVYTYNIIYTIEWRSQKWIEQSKEEHTKAPTYSLRPFNGTVRRGQVTPQKCGRYGISFRSFFVLRESSNESITQYVRTVQEKLPFL